MNVGSRDWLGASEVHLTTDFLEQSIQFTVTGSEIAVSAGREYESARLTEELNEVYDGEMEEEEEELTQHVKEYHRRRFSAG